MTEERIEAARGEKRSAPVFLEYGFRPFFLGAGIQAVVAMSAWLAWLYLLGVEGVPDQLTINVPVNVWHAHEMIFGYGLAVVAGFFLTAVPSWTKRQPVRGRTLGILFGLWLAARVTNWLSAFLPTALVALPELAFIGMLALLVGQALLSGWSRRNFLFLPVLAAMFAAALMYYLDLQYAGNLLALDILLILITVIGGRIVPAFTTNVLRRQGIAPLPRASDKRDVAAIVAVLAMSVLDLLSPGSEITGYVAAAAGVLIALRMVGWRTPRVLGSPILWILHLGFGWLAFGLVLKGTALITGAFGEIDAFHALTVGTIGSMTLGVMSRAALGHTGRQLKVSAAIVVAYMLISVSAIVRIAIPAISAGYYNHAILLSGMAWIVAFIIFTVQYWPILTRPRAGLNAGD